MTRQARPDVRQVGTAASFCSEACPYILGGENRAAPSVGGVAARIGLGLGVLSGATYGVIVFMAAATTPIAPPLLALLIAGETCDPADPDCKVVDAGEPQASLD